MTEIDSVIDGSHEWSRVSPRDRRGGGREEGMNGEMDVWVDGC